MGHRGLSKILSAPANLVCRPAPLRGTRSNLTARRLHGDSEMEDTVELQGLWWEWQWSVPNGWTSFDVGSSEKLEESFAMGERVCCLSHLGTYQYFGFAAGHEVNGPLRIRRIRVPSHAGHSASTCSTFVNEPGRENEASTTTWADADTFGSCWTAGFSCTPSGDDSLLLGSVAHSVTNSDWHENALDESKLTLSS